MFSNYLKIQKNNTKILIGIFVMLFVFSDATIAAKNKKRAAGKSKGGKGGITRATRSKSIAVKKQNTPEKISTQTTEIKTSDDKKDFVVNIADVNRYNCESYYFKCMNQYCFDEKNGRCGCKDVTKFTNSNNKCSYILNVCPSKLNDIVGNYKNGATSDCNEYAMKESREAPSAALSNVLAELTGCMQQKCVANRGEDQFLGCFDEDNLNKKFEACKNTYSHIQDVALLKDMFKKSIINYKQKYCDEIRGTLRNGECYLNIGLGASQKMIVKTKEFKIGDNVICTEEAFGAKLGEEDYRKLKYVKNIVLFGIDIVKTGVNVASKIVGQKANSLEAKEKADKKEEEIKVLQAESNVATAMQDIADNELEKALLTETISGNTKGMEQVSKQKTEVNKVVNDVKSKNDEKIAELKKDKGKLDAIAGENHTWENVLDGVQQTIGSQHLAGAIEGVMALNTEDFSRKGACYVIKGEYAKKLFDVSDEYYYKIRWSQSWEDVAKSVNTKDK